FKVLESELSGGYLDELCDAIDETMNGNFITANGLNNVSYFDNWTMTEFGKANITPSQDNPQRIDHVMFLWRNHPDFNGTGQAWYSFGSLIVGNPVSSYSQQGSFSRMPLSTCRHEYGHLMYGDNYFHAGGGGSHTNYFIPRAGGWSNMGLGGSSLLTWNAWDRQRLAWKAAGNVYNPAARNYNNTLEVSGDLDAMVSSGAGIYYLRDFVTTGDAISIKLPFIDPNTEFPEYIWIENHNGTDINGSPFDKWQWQSPNDPCIEPFIPGIMMYLQIDKEIKTSAVFSEVWGGYAGYIRPLTADGYHDREREKTTVQNACIDWGQQHAFTEIYPNPLTGDGDQGHYAIDANDDDMIRYEDEQLNYVQKFNGDYFKNLFQYGHTSHVFTLEGNNKVGICTNPSSASMMSMVGKNEPIPGENNLRKVYLNGVSIEILEQDTFGIKLQIEFDDVDVDNDVRWCADTIVLSPVQTTSGYSLNLKSGNTILLNQNLTATRMLDPVMFEGNKIFASPTHFKCRPDSWFHVEPSSTLTLEDKSKLILETDSRLEMETGSTIHLKDGSEIILQNGSLMEIGSYSLISFEENSKLIVEEGATLVVSDMVTFNSLLNNSEILVYGEVQLGTDIDFVGTGDAQLFVKIHNLSLNLTYDDCDFTNTALFAYNNESIISNCTYTGSALYGFYGTFLISTSNFVSSRIKIANASTNSKLVSITNNCNFSGLSLSPVIDIDNYPNYQIQNCSITNCSDAISLYNCGYGNQEQFITNNVISENSGTGITVYRTTTDILHNVIDLNGTGIKCFNRSVVHIEGDHEIVTQKIKNNSSYELLASRGSFPQYFQWNLVQDDDNIPGDPMVKYSGTNDEN
ncbi:MAG: hypothetical protein R2750_14480, partial [Bacteroidales bacterium]